MSASRSDSGHLEAMVALLEAQAQRIRVLQQSILSLEGRLGLLAQLDSIVADELRTPLTALQRALHTLRDLPAGDARGEECLDRALEHLRSLVGIVEEMLKPQDTAPAPA